MRRYHRQRASYDDSRINVLLQEDVFPDVDFIPLNVGEGYGFLRVMSAEERPNPRDIVIYESLPNELSRVAGIISTVPQTPLSHVNLRAVQDEAPNAFIRDAPEDSDIEGLIDSHVYYEVSPSGYVIRAATQAEVDEHYEALRPAESQTPQRDLSATSITPLSDITFDDWDSFGVKAANVAVMRTLGFPEGTVPEGFAVPFYFYDEFMKHNGLYDDIEEMLADADFQSDYDTKEDELKKLRKKIKKAETPEWIETALTAMHATFPEGTSLRYRSSTNNEDLPNFSGAGLYDSKTQHPEETEEDGISKSLKQVYASLWNFRAFVERDFHRIDHMAAAMGVLVHPNFSDELVNGVAVSVDPVYGTDGAHYVNSQAGEDLVTNPEANSVPEEVLLHPDGTYAVAAFSNQVPRGLLLMTGDQLAQLRRHLDAIHESFEELYDIEEGERFAMEIEFKITSDDVLAIKQARPWIFAGEPLAVGSGAAVTGRFEGARATHDGAPFRVVVEFSEVVDIPDAEFRDHALSVTGGRVTRVTRAPGRAREWFIQVAPDSPSADVTVALAHGLPCTVDGAICTSDGRQLSDPLEHTVKSLLPRVPDRPILGALSSGAAHLEVHLEWNDVDRAGSYEVQFLQSDRWRTLPAGGAEISFNGASAVVSALPAGDVYSFRVRGVNSDGASAWSAQLALPHRIVLESELTAGRQTDRVPSVSGYSFFGDLGTLSPDAFVVEDTTHTIEFLAHTAESLWLGVSPELPADFILRVGDSPYLGSQSMVHDIPAVAGVYWWPSPPPDLFGDNPVAVRLILHPDDQLGNRHKAPVTAYFRGFPSEHLKDEDVSFRINFSEGIATTAAVLRDHVLSVSGGTVSGVEAIGRDNRIWAVSITPESRNPVTVEIEADLDCELPEAVCATDGRRLFNRMELTVEPRPNNPAAGVPTTSGTAEVGETLTVDTSGISDADGMTGATFSYQWVSYDGNADTDIPGATASAYTLVASDEGKAFRVRLSFTDDAGYEESPTSPLARMERPYGLRAAASDGAVVLDWKQPAGWPYTSVYRILRNRPELGEYEPLVHVRYTEAGPATYTDADVEPGVLYVYRVKGSDFVGYTYEASEPVEVRTAESTSVEIGTAESTSVENSPAAGAPTIIGEVEVGKTLTVDTSGISDADGLTEVTFSYQWVSNDLLQDTDIEGARGPAYTPVPADAGNAIKVRVSFRDDAGKTETLTSPARTERPQALSAGASDGAVVLTWELPQRWGYTHYYYILRSRPELGEIEPLVRLARLTSGQTTYTDTDTDVEPGVLYVYRVRGADFLGEPRDASESVEIRIPEPTPIENSPASGAPTISGAAQVGETLSVDTSGIADADGLSGTPFIYQWVSNDGDEEKDIQGATGATYTATSNDAGKSIRVRVSFTDDAGNQESLTSAATAAVAPRPPLTASFQSKPSTHDGQTEFIFELHFSEEFGISYQILRDHAFTVTGGAVARARRLTQGSNTGWQITVTPNTDADVIVVLPATTDCTATGAICTGDSRKLSSRNEFTISGPGQ